ncbi:MAG: GTP-binding protein [Calditrichaeota bacterium]|nr:GTP-binding protein [Calditrichota bacterium]
MNKVVIQKKICVLGKFGVGKTSLIRQFVHGIFDDTYLSTIGVKVSQKLLSPIEISPGTFRQINMLVWDIEGFETDSRQLGNYLVGASGAIIVSDLTRSDSVALVSQIQQTFLEKNPAGKMIVLGNKTDVPVDKSENTAQLTQICNSLKLPHLLTSAKTGDNVESAFTKLGKLIAT